MPDLLDGWFVLLQDALANPLEKTRGWRKAGSIFDLVQRTLVGVEGGAIDENSYVFPE